MTGTVRGGNLDRTSLLTKNATSTVDSTHRINSIKRETLLRHGLRVSAGGTGTSDSRKNSKREAGTGTIDQEEEFCEVPESQLPDRVLSFMENNDLPAFVDKKKCNTIRFRTSRPEAPAEEWTVA